MVKLGIFYELDDEGKDTGRVQVADKGKDGIVYDTFDTEAEALRAMAEMQSQFDQENEAKKEYLQWERDFLSRHSIKREDLRSFLVNVVIV